MMTRPTVDAVATKYIDIKNSIAIIATKIKNALTVIVLLELFRNRKQLFIYLEYLQIYTSQRMVMLTQNKMKHHHGRTNDNQLH